MGKITADMSVSLDGFVTSPDPSPQQALGKGGEILHAWLENSESFRQWDGGRSGGSASSDSDVFKESFENIGAMIMGRNMFDHAIEAWGENPPFHVPIYVLTHRPQETLVKEGGTRFIFVTDGIERALNQARESAGDKIVSVSSANAIQQFIKAGWLDELQLHIVPVLLGDGAPMFDKVDTPTELEIVRVVASEAVTHIKYRFTKGS